MKETTKAMVRRWGEHARGNFPWSKVFGGDICDVGSGDDPLTLSAVTFIEGEFPRITCIDAPDGAGDDLSKFVGSNKFDCIHGSNVLEHAIDPAAMLRSWIECLKPGGYIVATVPDWELYEKRIWPSKWNAGHRSVWSLDPSEYVEARTPLEMPIVCKLPEWLNQFLNTGRPMEILLCRLVDTSDHSLPNDVDQTLPPDGAEVFIEFVLHRVV